MRCCHEADLLIIYQITRSWMIYYFHKVWAFEYFHSKLFHNKFSQKFFTTSSSWTDQSFISDSRSKVLAWIPLLLKGLSLSCFNGVLAVGSWNVSSNGSNVEVDSFTGTGSDWARLRFRRTSRSVLSSHWHILKTGVPSAYISNLHYDLVQAPPLAKNFLNVFFYLPLIN